MSGAEFYNALFLNNKVFLSKAANEDDKNKLDPNVTTLVFCSQIEDESSQSLLENIMKSCKLEQGFETIVQPKAWRNYRDLNVREVILFGVSEDDLQLNIQLPKNWPMKFDHTTWIKTDSLADLVKHKNLKNELWLNALKPYFSPS